MAPRVSIGLPVYNGEKYVGTAIESLLAQTMPDFELVVCDNASTDGTSDLCAGYAARDRRVRHHRNERNIGGGPNMNRAFELATAAPLYKWAASDDYHAPTFLERCLAALEADPTAVLAFSKAELVDSDGKTIRERVRGMPLDAPDTATRFAAILPSYDCLEMFSIMRREAMTARPILGPYADADGVFLAGMTLRGRFLEVPEVLFFNRRHDVQAGAQFHGHPRDWAAWWEPSNKGKRLFPAWRRHAELWRKLATAPLPVADRARCALAMARYTNWRKHRLYEDVKYHVDDLLGRAKATDAREG